MQLRLSITGSLLFAAALLLGVAWGQRAVWAGEEAELSREIAELRAAVQRLKSEQENLSPAQRLAERWREEIKEMLHEVLRQSDRLARRMFADVSLRLRGAVQFRYVGPGPHGVTPTTEELRESVFHVWLDLAILPATWPPAGELILAPRLEVPLHHEGVAEPQGEQASGLR